MEVPIFQKSGSGTTALVDQFHLNNQENDNDQEENNHYDEAYSSASLQDMICHMSSTYDVVYCHPQAFFNTPLGEKLMTDKVFQNNVVAVVADECHILVKW